MTDTNAGISDRITDLLARVRAAGHGGANGAVTDADVAWLASLDLGTQADALHALCDRTGAQKSVLKARVKAASMRRADTRGALRLVGPDESPVDNWRASARYNREGDLLGCVDNALAILRNAYAGRLAYDVKGLVPYLDGERLDDDGMTRLRGELGSEFSCSLHVGDFRAAVLAVAKEQRTFSPVADYLNGLAHDGRPRLWTMARDHLQLEDDYSCMVVARTMIAAVARGLVGEWAPHGFMVKTVPIILGMQDRKKSTFWQTVGTPGGRPWYGCSKVDVEKRQAPITLAAKWWYEFPEIDGWLSKHSNEAAKAWTAQPDDDFVPPYGASNLTQPRSFVVVGTTNKGKFLTDPTGSNRWLVLDVRPNGPRWKVNVAHLRAELDQLYAEAAVEFRAYLADRAAGVSDDDNPHRWWLSDDENDNRARRNAEHQIESAWAPTVGAWLAGAPATCQVCRGTGGPGGGCSTCSGRGRVERGPLPVDRLGREYVTLPQVLSDALGVPTSMHPKSRNDAVEALAECGWHVGEGPRPTVHLSDGRTYRPTAYYQDAPQEQNEGDPEPSLSFATVERRRGELARELDAIDAVQDQIVREEQ